MQTKIVSSKILLMIVFGGFALFAMSLSYFSLKNRTESDLVPPTVNIAVQEKEGVPLPVRLKIPKITVDAKVELMGLTSDGAMEAPKRGRNVGWYSAGSRPGEVGSAVMDGHYGTWKNGEGSVFDNLNKLEKGDRVSVEDEKGTLITFVVRESREYDSNADATDVFDSSDGKVHLNLITCEGVWNKDSKSYSQRLVVFTDKE
ncbi:MAG: class F sortase [Candidatus Moranbacteria bacterium]|nr:class F sortase [Candidatus Moranbacteria bacterium]